MRIGASDAEHDELLGQAFVQTADLLTVRNRDDPRSLVVARTGMGKSAILLQLEREVGQDHCIRIDPEALAMQYISNSTIIPYLASIGVNLSQFYKLLWRHVFFVELMGARWGFNSSTKKGPFTRWLESVYTDPGKKRCLEYFERFGGTFFTHADKSVKNVIQKFDKDVRARFGAELPGLSAEAGVGSSASVETQTEIKARAQEIVNQIQVRELKDALRILKEDVLNDEMKFYFVLIDDLDRPWVEQAYQYQLIEALIEEVRDFSDVPAVKIVVALRDDILHRILRRRERRPLQQREKYHTVSLSLRWTREQLEELVNRRLAALFATKLGKVTLDKILPPARRSVASGRQEAIEYLFERTWMRPRDLIHFLNFCMDEATGKSRFTWTHLTRAEANYSADRLASMIEEWGETYPGLGTLLDSLREVTVPFKLAEFDPIRVVELLEIGEREAPGSSEAALLAQFAQRGASDVELVVHLFRLLYTVGAIGVKQSPQDPYAFSHEQPNLLDNGISAKARLIVHRALWRALGVRPPTQQAT